MIDFIFLLITFIVLSFISRTKVSLIFVFLSHLYYLVVMLGYFHIYKFSGLFDPFYPDELTYLEGRTDLLFSKYVSYLYMYFDEHFFRFTNFIIYTLSWVLVFNSLVHRKIKYITYIGIVLAMLGVYWTYFILKESLSIGFLILLLYSIYKKNVMLLIFSVIGVSIARPSLFVLLVGGYVFQYLFYKSRAIFVLASSLLLGLCYLFLNSTLSLRYKLMITSRRFGETNKVFDDGAKQVSEGGAIDFLFSSVYLESITANITRTFYPIYYGFGIASVLIALNIFVVIYCICRVIRNKYMDEFDAYLLLSTSVLILTHSVYRYENIVVLTYLAFIIMKRKEFSK